MADSADLIAVEHGGRVVRFRPPGGRIEGILRANAFYEQQMLEYIEALALPGVYADVGSYIGTHALFFAAMCPASRVLAFEPRPHILEHLRHNVEVNQLGDRIDIHPFGLSDREETATVTLDGREVSFACHRLDSLVAGPVSLMKLDVEGMEEKVLAGAAEILERSRPLLFAEAHQEADLSGILRALAPYGYRPTGRVFNHTATYELAAPGSPVAPPERLPAAVSLLDSALWAADDPALAVETGAGRLRVVSRLEAERAAHVSQEPVKLTRPPKTPAFVPAAGATFFLDVAGQASPELQAWIYLMEYRGGTRTEVQRHRVARRAFQKIAFHPGTEAVRVALRLTGPGTLEVERLALHSVTRPA